MSFITSFLKGDKQEEKKKGAAPEEDDKKNPHSEENKPLVETILDYRSVRSGEYCLHVSKIISHQN